MSNLPIQARTVYLAGLLVPPLFVYLGAPELGFTFGIVAVAYWLIIIAEAWMDFGKPSTRVLLGGSFLLIWPSSLLAYLTWCRNPFGC